MSYCTYNDLLTQIGEPELIQLTDRTGAGVIDYTVLDAAMARADARINRYLTAYLPITAVPDDFVQIACDITRYFLYNDQPTDHVKKQYDDAISYLEKVATGKIPIGPDATGITDAKTVDDIAYSVADTVFSNTNLDGF